MKLLSVAVPCYNSAAYMKHCIETLLPGGEEIEILVVDDGSKDETLSIAQQFEKQYPGIVRAIHQENAGHGGAVNTGLANATGQYFKVVDSDDWVDTEVLGQILAKLRSFVSENTGVDLLISNYVYDKVGVSHKKVMRYSRALTENQVLTWPEVSHMPLGHYILMHSVIYRTQMLRDCGLVLPTHTFYVDNLYVYLPMQQVKKLYYMDVNFYHYFIGRGDQSVNEAVMIKRIDQQLRVNKLMVDSVRLQSVPDRHQRQYMFTYIEIITTVSNILLLKAGTEECKQKQTELWQYIEEKDPWLYRRLRRRILGRFVRLPGKGGRMTTLGIYKIAQKIVGFN